MAYKKPQIVAKSEPKQTYVAGCPNVRRSGLGSCGGVNYNCQMVDQR